MLIGILPTVTTDHTVLDNISANPRYRLLNTQILDARGDDIVIDIRGPERLQVRTESILPEAANTSIQFHLQVEPETFANYWNAAQAIAGVEVAVGANSPYLFGRRLWAETRVPLFEQATDTRQEELKNQGVRSASVVRGAVDHVDLRPVRGERALLPGAAAHLRGGGSRRGARRRWGATAGRATPA